MIEILLIRFIFEFSFFNICNHIEFKITDY